MLSPSALIRDDLLPGFQVRLFGDQPWTIPGPEYIGADTDRDSWFRMNYAQIVIDLLDASTEAEYRQAELALVICLMARNYRLAPDDYQELFGACHGPDELRAAIGRIVGVHLDAIIPRRHRIQRPARARLHWVRHVAGRIWGAVSCFPTASRGRASASGGRSLQRA